MFTTSNDIIRHFAEFKLDSSPRSYINTHAKRYAYLLSRIKELRKNISTETISTLDIGPSFFTEIYRKEFPMDNFYTLGLDAEINRGGHFPVEILHDKKCHFHFNLNDTQFNVNKIDGMPKFDIIIMAEVIEHLYTSPSIVLNYLKQYLKPKGFLIIQTPNAAELSKRTKLMFQGKNPYEMIRKDHPDNAGHFREYTKKELVEISNEVGLTVKDVILTNYLLYDSKKSEIYKLVRSFSWPNFRRYIFMILSND